MSKKLSKKYLISILTNLTWSTEDHEILKIEDIVKFLYDFDLLNTSKLDESTFIDFRLYISKKD